MIRTYLLKVCSLLSLAFLVALVCQETAGAAGVVEKRGAEVIHLFYHDVSKPLREIPPVTMPSGVKRIHSVKPLPPLAADPNAPVGGGLDKGLQTWMGPLSMPSTTTSFDGVSANGSAPPDTNGDVGPSHYVQTVNTKFAVYNKTGSVLYGPVNINTLWSGFGGGCQTNNDGDPTVTYDQFNDRWIISQFSVSTTPYMQCVAVSTTGDPTGSYYRYSYSFGTGFNDYPKFGEWNGDYYITYNMFANGASFSGGKVCAYQGSKLRANQANSMQCFDEPDGGLLAADQDGTVQAPAGAPEYVISFGSNLLNLWKMKIDWTTPANSTFTKSTISVNSFTEACSGGTCITQPGTTQQLDSLADRMMNRFAYRNRSGVESFVTNHSVSSSGVSSIRWYELRTNNSSTTTPTLFQQGTYSPDTNHRWMGSIAMDQSGDIAVGYSVSSSANSVKPSVRYAGRLIGDPAGTLSQGEAEMKAGGGVQTGGLSRWGDYSNMVIDPTDDCSFWFTTEYLASSGSFNWSTRIGKFKFSTCGGGTGDTVAPTTSLTAPAGGTLTGTVTVSANASDNIGVTNVEFYANSTYIGSDTTTPYSISWDTTGAGNGPYTLTSRAYDAAGNVGTSAGVNVTVNNPGQAAYDATLKAPSCASVNSFCDSIALLDGRATLGPEPNQPNTINNSCADGASGTYHSDESVDRLKVATNDSSSLGVGKAVTISATVWCYGTTDTLDLYYAANANSPSWTLIGSQPCAVSGQAVTMTAGYTLPTGALQSVRANFRYNGSQSSCSTGSYDDHDDLIFAVGSGSTDTTPPTTSITAPSGGTVTGTIAVNANASDNVGVTKVEFYEGANLIGSDTTSPYGINWDTTTVANGPHTLTSKAYDAANNVGTSAGVNVTVSNATTCGTSTQLFLNPGFESGATGWTQSPGGLIRNTAARPAHSGTWYAMLNGLGVSSSHSIYQQIVVPANACSAQLTFWVRIDTAETTTTKLNDKLSVQVGTKPSTSWKYTTIATYSNLDANNTYVQKTLDLSAYKGMTIRVRFGGRENATLQTTFVIDDTAANITQ